MQEQEIWKDIEGYEGKYQVSNLGRVRSFCGYGGKRVLIRKLALGKKGQVYVCLGRRDTKKVSRLVAKAFVPGYQEDLKVTHLDENCQNNRWDNLKCMTANENLHYGTKFQRSAVSNGVEVEQMDLDGRVVATYHSISEASRATNIPNPSISLCCNGKRKTTGGFKWRRVEKVTIPEKKPPLFKMKDSENERWADVQGYEGLYQVSTLGRVYSLSRQTKGSRKRGGFLKWQSPKYYPSVKLHKDGVCKKFFVHRLVAIAFVDGYDPSLEVNHIDENTGNPRFDNLEWVSRLDNVRHGTGIERAASTRYKPVLQISLDGKVIREFKSIRDAAKAVDGSSTEISRCCSHKRGMTKHRGYRWAYANNNNEKSEK